MDGRRCEDTVFGDLRARGRIVFASSSRQVAGWLTELNVPAPPVRTLSISEVVPGAVVEEYRIVLVPGG